MIKTIYLLLIVTITLNFVLAYDDEEYANDQEDYRQLVNLQTAQKGIIKKDDDIKIEPLSEIKIQHSLNELKQDYSRVDNWPTSSKKLGAISAVTLNVYKNAVIFHRAERTWTSDTFDNNNYFKQKRLGPITSNTIITFDQDSGKILDEWGSNMFYMPHGLSIFGDYYYVTDVALHQVLRFNIKNSTTKPDLVLGEAFKPGKSAKTFCKPTSTASLSNGDFFVADGYCNSRILKFNFAGEKILEWGKSSFSGEPQTITPPYSFAVPHALTLVPDKELVCVADRENGRIQCFFWSDGKFHSQYHNPILGDRLFSVDCANNSLFVVNGPDYRSNLIQISGYTINMDSNNVTSKFGSFVDPHDIAVSSDAKEIYVADLSPDKNQHRLHKFLLNGLKPTTTSGDISSIASNKMNVHKGQTALLVGSIVMLFTIFTIGIAILISRKHRRGNEENEYHSLMTK